MFAKMRTGTKVLTGFGKLDIQTWNEGFRGDGGVSAIMNAPLAAEERIVLDTMGSEDFRAEPEFLCSVGSRTGSPLPDGRVDLNAVPSGYADTGSAIVPVN